MIKVGDMRLNVYKCFMCVELLMETCNKNSTFIFLQRLISNIPTYVENPTIYLTINFVDQRIKRSHIFLKIDV